MTEVLVGNISSHFICKEEQKKFPRCKVDILLGHRDAIVEKDKKRR